MCIQIIVEIVRNSILITGPNSFKMVLGKSSKKFKYQSSKSNIL